MNEQGSGDQLKMRRKLAQREHHKKFKLWNKNDVFLHRVKYQQENSERLTTIMSERNTLRVEC